MGKRHKGDKPVLNSCFGRAFVAGSSCSSDSRRSRDTEAENKMGKEGLDLDFVAEEGMRKTWRSRLMEK